MAPFTKADRIKGFEGMRDALTPAARVRRRFLQGRPRKVSVRHTPLSAISAAVEAITDVLEYINNTEPTLPLDSARCGLVYVLGQEASLRWVTPDERNFAALHQELTALPEFVCIGLVFLIQEQVGDSVNVGGWAKPFIWSNESVTILGGMLERSLDKWRQKLNEPKQTPEVTKFLADAKAFPWITFHLVLLDGSFFPASADVSLLNEAVLRLGCAGFIGFVHKKSTDEVVQMIRPYGVESPEAEAALKSAADVINPNAIHAGPEWLNSDEN